MISLPNTDIIVLKLSAKNLITLVNPDPTPLASFICNTNPSHADVNSAIAPPKVFSCVSAISLAAPSALTYLSVNVSICSVCFDKINNADIAFLPTSSSAPAKSNPFAAKSFSASPTGLPVVATSDKIRRSAVPALLPEIPAFAKAPSIAVVSSNDTPALLAIGATNFMDSANFSMSSAEVLKDFAITSVTCIVSSAVKPIPRTVAPATSAALAKSLPVAAAKFRVASVAAKISCSVNPNLANSTCNCDTCDAVNAVVAPNRFASSSNFTTPSRVVPRTEAKLATPWSKSLIIPKTFLTAAPTPTTKPSCPKTFFNLPTACP